MLALIGLHNPSFATQVDDGINELIKRYEQASPNETSWLLNELAHYSDDPRVQKAIANAFKIADPASQGEILSSSIFSNTKAVKLQESILMDALQSKDKAILGKAMVALRRMPSKSISNDLLSPLFDLLGHDDRFLSRQAAGIIAYHGSAETIKRLHSNFQHINETIRLQSAIALGQHKSLSASKPLLSALTSSDKELRASATLALGDIPSKEVIEQLRKALNDDYWKVRFNAIVALGWEQTPAALEPIQAAIEQGNAEEKNRALYLLSTSKLIEAIEPLENLLKSKEPRERGAAIKSLRRIDSPRVIPIMIKGLTDADERVRELTIRELFYLKSSDPQLTALIPYMDDPKDEIKVVAIGALLYQQHPLAVEKAIDIIANKQLPSKLLEPLIESLGDAKITTAEKQLIELLEQNDRDLSWSVSSALAAMGSSQATDALIKELHSANIYFQQDIAAALGKTQKTPSIVKALMTILDDKQASDYLKNTAALSLAQLQATEATDKIIELAANNSGMIKALATMNNPQSLAFLINILETKQARDELVMNELKYSQSATIAEYIASHLDNYEGLMKHSALSTLGAIGTLKTLDSVRPYLEHETYDLRHEASETIKAILKAHAKELSGS